MKRAIVVGIACGIASSVVGCASDPGGAADAPHVHRPFGFTRTIDVSERTAQPAAANADESGPANGAGPASAPSVLDPQSDEGRALAAFEVVTRELGRKGTYRTPLVYTVTVPRDDLAVVIEGMEVPVEAGLESTFHFYWCPCGKTCVVGAFCVQEHEVNDVIDALRAAKIEVVSVAPMLLHARQRPTVIRFFAEGRPEPIGKAVREALRWTGKERMAPVVPLRGE